MTNTATARRADPIAVAIATSSLGFVLVARTGKGIAAVLLGDNREALRQDLERRFPAAAVVDGDEALEALAKRVVAVVESPARASDRVNLPLDLHGSAFQLLVWAALREIEPGSTATYAEIATRIGRPTSVRAVAGACAANPVAILVPCHRVVRSDGGLSGYRWGVDRKRALLAREQAGAITSAR